MIAAQLVAKPVAELASLYNADFLLHQVTGLEIAGLLLVGTALGWLAARWSVAMHLRQIQPR